MAKYRKRVCTYCKDKNEPNYKDVPSLRRFTTEKGKIIPRSKTGICAKHGRFLSSEIKKARYMALLPFTLKMK